MAASLGIAFGLVGGAAFGVFAAWLIGPDTLPPTAALLYCGPALAAFYISWYVRKQLGDPISLGQGIVRPFLEGTRDALRHRRARHALVGLGLWFFVALAATVVLVRVGFRECREKRVARLLACARGSASWSLRR